MHTVPCRTFGTFFSRFFDGLASVRATQIPKALAALQGFKVIKRIGSDHTKTGQPARKGEHDERRKETPRRRAR